MIMFVAEFHLDQNKNDVNTMNQISFVCKAYSFWVDCKFNREHHFFMSTRFTVQQYWCGFSISPKIQAHYFDFPEKCLKAGHCFSMQVVMNK